MAKFERARLRVAAVPGISLLAPNAAVWVVLLIAVPIIAIFLDLATGVRVDIQPFVDNDYWWHLATGNWILDHHRVPTTDPFSWTYGGQNWIAHEWLAELILAVSVRTAGYAGAIALTAVVCVVGTWRLLAAAFFYGMSRRLALILLLLTGPTFLRPGAMIVRPQVWTWALLGILFAELAAYDTGRRKQLWFLPVLFAVWINLNLTALIGLGCLGAFVLDRLIRRPVDRHVVKVGVLSGLALLINPRHVELFTLLTHYLDPNAITRRFVLEWMPPRRDDSTVYVFFVGLLLLIPAVYFLIRRRPHFWPGAPLIVLAYQSKEAVRYVPIYLMLAIVFVGWLIWAWRDKFALAPEPERRSFIPRKPWVLAPALAATAFALLIVTQSNHSQFREDPVSFRVPDEVTDVYLQYFPDARLFNTYDFGGYLIDRFYGTDSKVYIDGREDMYGERRVNEYFYFVAGSDGWQQYFDSNGVDAAMVRSFDGLAKAMAGDPGWRIAYQTNSEILFVRQI